MLGVTPATSTRGIADSLHRVLAPAGHQPADRDRATCCSRCPTRRAESVDAFILQRTATRRRAKLPVPPFPPAPAYVSGAVPVWRIRADRDGFRDGVTFAREAVVRPSADAAGR